MTFLETYTIVDLKILTVCMIKILVVGNKSFGGAAHILKQALQRCVFDLHS